MEILGYIIIAGVVGFVAWRIYDGRSKKSSGSGTGGGGRNPVNTRVKKQ